MINFRDQAVKDAWQAAVEMAKEVGLHEHGSGKSEYGAMSLLDLYKYLDEYGCYTRPGGGDPVRLPDEEHPMRIVVSTAWDLGKHGFNLLFERRRKDEDSAEWSAWSGWMVGGAVYRAGEGWSVHT